mmetsp:Transcript_72370/g.143686  ORF Transcript_72370/g.143686 Transcript_72370/m.143686 type:complete len:99 (-) Transcript_72370:243-539(-)
MSERALADTPGSTYALATRAHVLVGVMHQPPTEGDANGQPLGWTLGRRSAAQLREAAVLLKRQALLEPAGSLKASSTLANSAALLQAALKMEDTPARR